jgi:hypothetical protein
MASAQTAFDDAIATIKEATALEARWKEGGRSDDSLLAQVLRLYGQSVAGLDDTLRDGSLNEKTEAKVSKKRGEVAGRIEKLELQRSAGPAVASATLQLRSGAGSAYKDAAATLKEAAEMDSRVKKGEAELVIDTVRLYSHAVRLMLLALSTGNCKQEVQTALEGKLVEARKRIAVLSTRTDGPTLRKALDRDAADFPDLAPVEPAPEAEEAHPPAARTPKAAAGPRWCKKCQVAFEGDACSKGHPNFLYTRKVPPEAKPPPRPASSSPAPAPAPAPPAGAAPRSPRKMKRNTSWDGEKPPAAAPAATTHAAMNEAQVALQEQARQQKLKAAEAKKKRAEKKLRRMSAMADTDAQKMAAAQAQAAAATAELEAVQEASPLPSRAGSLAVVEDRGVNVEAEAQAEAESQAQAAEAAAMAAAMRERLAAKKAEKAAAAAAAAQRAAAREKAEREALPAKTIVPMVDIGMIRAKNPARISDAKVASTRAAIRHGYVEVAVGGRLQVATPGDMEDLSEGAKQRAIKGVTDARAAAAAAEAARKTIVPLVDIGLIRAVNPAVRISQAKVAGVRAAIKRGAVEVPVGGRLQTATSADIADLRGGAKQRAIDELAQNRVDEKVQEILRSSSAEHQAAAQAEAMEKAARLAEVAAAKERAAEERQAQAAAARAQKTEAREAQEAKAKAKAAKKAAAAAVAKEKEAEQRQAKERRAREASAAAAAKRKPLLTTGSRSISGTSSIGSSGPPPASPPPPAAAAAAPADVVYPSAGSDEMPIRIGLRQPALPLADLAAQPLPRQYLRDAVGPAVTSALYSLARGSRSHIATPEKAAGFLSKMLLAGPEAEGAAAAADPTAVQGEGEGEWDDYDYYDDYDYWRGTVRPLLASAMAQLDRERPADETEAVQLVARALTDTAAAESY